MGVRFKQVEKNTHSTNTHKEDALTLVELLLVAGTLGIFTGVWVTLAVIVSQNRKQNELAHKNARPKFTAKIKKGDR